jgi:Flp pilus assembly pilin Flp
MPTADKDASLAARGRARALEYGLVVGLIALCVIAGLGVAGGTLSQMFNMIGGALSNVTPGA